MYLVILFNPLLKYIQDCSKETKPSIWALISAEVNQCSVTNFDACSIILINLELNYGITRIHNESSIILEI